MGQGGLTCNFLMCLLHFSCVIKHFLMCLLHFDTLWASFWEPIGFSWGLLFGMLVGLWSFFGILWGQHGARTIKMRVSKSILAQVEVARGLRGSQWVDYGKVFITRSVLFGILVYLR